MIINFLQVRRITRASEQWASLGNLSNYNNHHNDNFKKQKVYDQNNSSARASRSLVHFFDVHCTTTTWHGPWHVLIWLFMEDVDIRRRNFLFLNLNKILKNSTQGEVACIWHIERIQINAIKFEGTQIHFFWRRFHWFRRRRCLRSLLSVFTDVSTL